MRQPFLQKLWKARQLKRSLRGLPKDSTLDFPRITAVLAAHRRALSGASSICSELFESLDLEALFSPLVRGPAALTLAFLAERLIVTPSNLIDIAEADPFLAHSDLAALNRGLFETSVNVCYLLTEDQDLRFRQFWVSSVQHELKLQQSMLKWLDSEDAGLKTMAKKQASIKDATTDSFAEEVSSMAGEVGKYPSIWKRCEKLGPAWAFFYDARYRGLSSWQHGDHTRAFAALSARQFIRNQWERPIFETLVQCLWAWEFVLLCSEQVASDCGKPEVSRVLDQLNRVVRDSVNTNLRDAITKFQGA